MELEQELRIVSYDKSQQNLPLAKEYHKFLKGSTDGDDREIRMICLDMRAGKPIEDINELYLFFKGALD